MPGPRRQTAIERLSEEGRSLLHRMLDQEAEPWDIRRAVHRLTGEYLTLPGIIAYAERYEKRSQQRRQARAETDDFIRLAGKRGVKISELLRAFLIENLDRARRNGQLKDTDLFKLDDAERKRRELELKQKQARQSAKHKKREMELKEQQAQLAERRFNLDQEKARALLEKLDRKAKLGKSLTADDVRRIREIYGIYDDAPPEPPPDDSS